MFVLFGLLVGVVNDSVLVFGLGFTLVDARALRIDVGLLIGRVEDGVWFIVVVDGGEDIVSSFDVDSGGDGDGIAIFVTVDGGVWT